MCGRFVAATDPEGLIRFLVVDERQAEDLPPSYNVAPTQDVYAAAEHDGRRHLVSFRWGLIPPWADDPRIGARMINARVETLLDKPAFREPLQRRRCLIPADGFYEWTTDAGVRTPHFIHQPSGEPLAFAGLWSTWRAPDGEPVRSCTIVTRPATADVERLHDRMPVALPRDAWSTWLDSDTPARVAHATLTDTPPPALVFRRADPRVNDHRCNDPDLIRPAA